MNDKPVPGWRELGEADPMGIVTTAHVKVSR
jgi:hypothetical protein